MTIVSNTSPIINLAWINKLDLLHKLFGEIVIPEAVWREVVVDGAGQPGADEVKTATWIKTQDVTNKALVQALRQELDAGEAEAIALALEIKAELLLMDERLGRETAHYLGLHYTGLIGVLIEAKRERIIDTIKPYLNMLRDIAGFRISNALYMRVLRDEREI
jgi:predicted nucleic acid-binding protein